VVKLKGLSSDPFIYLVG
jgi:hypothetical protein